MRHLTLMLVGLAALHAVATAHAGRCVRRPGARSATECRVCHKEIYQEWLRSAHAASWQSRPFQKFRRKSRRAPECATCHAPKPIFETGLHALPEGRRAFRGEGVSCITCHAQGAAVIGPYGVCVTHLSHQSLTMKRDDVCKPCHQHKCARYLWPLSCKTHQMCSHRRSLRSRTQSCQDCHMPARKGKLAQMRWHWLPTRTRHDHASGSSRKVEKIGQALEISAEAHDGEILVSFVNARSGHDIPGSDLRTLVAEIRFLDDMESPLEHRREFFAQYLGNRIRPGESRILSYPRKIRNRGVRILLYWRLFHDQPPDKWALVKDETFRWGPRPCKPDRSKRCRANAILRFEEPPCTPIR